MIDRVWLPKCLIDTGSQVNMIPTKDVTAHGFKYFPGGIQSVRGYDGREGKILGKMKVKLLFGPAKRVKAADFLVSSDIRCPIIGMPTLRQFGFTIDCKNHSLNSVETGEVVRCSAVAIDPKN